MCARPFARAVATQAGLRTDSSNYDPVPGWIAGAPRRTHYNRLAFSRRRLRRRAGPVLGAAHSVAAPTSVARGGRIRKPSCRTELPDVYDADVGQPREVQGEWQLRVRVAVLSRTDKKH
jgi:hypothetical protein